LKNYAEQLVASSKTFVEKVEKAKANLFSKDLTARISLWLFTIQASASPIPWSMPWKSS